MKFVIDLNQKNYFKQNQFIEFEDLLNPAHLHKLQQGIDQAVDQGQDRDVWRSGKATRNIVTQKQLAETAYELIEHKPIRLGFDQYFPLHNQEEYARLLQRRITLAEFCCLQGVLCGLMLCVRSGNDTASASVFSHRAGNGIYFNPMYEIDFSPLQSSDASYLLIVYVHANSVYIKQDNDPNLHALKHLGYTFGDKLKDNLNPIVYR